MINIISMKDFMFTLIAWLVTLPLIVASVVFALYNPEPISVIFNPFLSPVEVPLYMPVLAAIAFGFLFGAVMTWAAMGRLRRDKRQMATRIRTLEKELADARTNAASPDYGYQKPKFLLLGRK